MSNVQITDIMRNAKDTILLITKRSYDRDYLTGAYSTLLKIWRGYHAEIKLRTMAMWMWHSSDRGCRADETSTFACSGGSLTAA